MKLRTVVTNTNQSSFSRNFINHAHILFRECESDISVDGENITVKLAEKNSPNFDKELTVTFQPGKELGQMYVVFDNIPTFGYKGMISPSFSIAAFLHNTYRCTKFTDIDTGTEVNILGRTGGMRMNLHTSDTPMHHDLGILTI